MFSENPWCPAIFPLNQSNDSEICKWINMNEQWFVPSSKHKNDDDRRWYVLSMLIYWSRVYIYICIYKWIEAAYGPVWYGYVFMAIVSVHYLFTSIYEASTEKIVPVGWTFRNPRWALDLNSDTFILGILVCFFRHLWTGDPISHHQTIQVGWIWFGKMQDTATSTLWPSIHFYSETHPKPLQFCVQIWDPGKKTAPGAENQLAPDLMVSDQRWRLEHRYITGSEPKDTERRTCPTAQRLARLWCESWEACLLGATPFRAIYFSHRSLKPKEDPTKNAGVCNWEHTHKSPTPSCAATCHSSLPWDTLVFTLQNGHGIARLSNRCRV